MKRNVLFIFLTTLSLISGCTGAQMLTPTQTPLPTLTSTTEPTAILTPTPEPAYDLCPNIEDFRDCYIPVEELLDGSYWYWLNEIVAPTLLEEFQAREDKIKHIPFGTVGLPSGSAIIYDVSTAPNYEDPETAPFERDVTFGYTEWLMPNGQIRLYRIVPIFYYKEGIIDPIITVVPIKNEGAIEIVNKYFDIDMNIPVILFTETYDWDEIVMNDPIVSQSYEKMGKGEVKDRLNRFYFEKDTSALSGPGIVLQGVIAKTDFFK